MKRFAIGPAEVGSGRLLVVAGPCVVEGADACLKTAAHLKALCVARDLPFVFKASYRKANRSSGRSFEGLPVAEALGILGRVRREIGVPVLTDIHEAADVAAAAAEADVLQIPAFLSRQTALLQAAARSGRAVNVKKGQFLAPDDMKQVVEKLTAAGCDRILLTERGTTFGYHDLVVDMRGLVRMRDLGWPVLYDATHSLQRPGGEVSGGERRYAPPLMRAAVACGVDGLFFETHPDPPRALSDAATQLPLAEAEDFLDQARRIHEAAAERAHA
ncbi:MAG TPA: 3-deoxy-8-phosphooctulonate synthase [Candidatus Eisenbacteria bacterium]